MKTLRFTRFAATVFAVCLMGWAGVQAQDCETYFPFRHNSAIEQTHYNSKGKVETVVTTTVVDKEREGAKIIMTATAKAVDGKGKELSNSSYDVSCENGEFHMDMRAMSMPQNQMQGVEGIEMKIESGDIVWPKDLSVGTTLPDGHMTMTATMNGMTISNTEITIFNRKVVGTEKRTTPAGTFDCIIIEEDSRVKAMGMNMESHSKGWYAKNVGSVRQESYRNGKMESYFELTKVVNN